jgi:pentatricopeptide repeat protein
MTCRPHQQAAEELARGQQQGWAANSQVYEAMVTSVCEAGHLSEAIEIVNRMKVPTRIESIAPRDRIVFCSFSACWAQLPCACWTKCPASCQRPGSPERSHVMFLLQREGVMPTTRHVYPILRTYAAGGALEYLQERVLLDVATSTDIRIDADCFNCLLRVRQAVATSPGSIVPDASPSVHRSIRMGQMLFLMFAGVYRQQAPWLWLQHT